MAKKQTPASKTAIKLFNGNTFSLPAKLRNENDVLTFLEENPQTAVKVREPKWNGETFVASAVVSETMSAAKLRDMIDVDADDVDADDVDNGNRIADIVTAK